MSITMVPNQAFVQEISFKQVKAIIKGHMSGRSAEAAEKERLYALKYIIHSKTKFSFLWAIIWEIAPEPG